MPEYLILIICFAPFPLLIGCLIFRKRLGRWFKFLICLVAAWIVFLFLPLYLNFFRDEMHRSLRAEKIQAKEYADRVKLRDLNKIELKEVPNNVVSVCRDSMGRIANYNEAWNSTDVFDLKPQSHLLLVCQYPDGSWYIQCEKGGFTIQRLQFKISKDSNNQWQATQLGGDLKEFCPSDVL